MSRYVCCGCHYRYTHRVLSFEVVASTEERCPYVKITINNPTVANGEFLCVKFRSIPSSLISYPIRIEINGCDVPVENSCGRELTTADLYECIMLSGIYKTNPCPRYVVC